MHNKSIFSKNVKILQDRDPVLASRVLEAQKDPSYKVIHSKSDFSNVLVMRDHDAVALYDNNDPMGYCREYLERLNMKYAPVVVFCGLGLGYHLDLFFKKYSKRLETEEIIIFEHDMKLFRAALELGDFQAIIARPNIHFLIGENPENALLKIQSVLVLKRNRIKLRSLKIIPLPSSIELNEAYYARAIETVKTAAQKIMINAGNAPFDSFFGLDNILKNVTHILSNPGINLLYYKFKLKPAVVVAAGPSLNKNMQLLQDLRERALIICCDASFKPIMKQGIKPHIVVSLERTAGVERLFLDTPDFEGIYFAVCPVVMPGVFDAFKGTKIITYREFSHFDWLEIDKGKLNTGPSVANMAFKTAEVLGCDPIILIGQDLAFGADGNTHTKEGEFGERLEWLHKLDVYEVEGNDGNPIKTNKAWDVFRLAYEEHLEKYLGTCINATEGGAKIKGAKVMPFKDAISKYCTELFYPERIIQKAITGFDSNVNVKREMQRICKKAESTRRKMDELIKKFKELICEIDDIEEEIVQPYMLAKTDIDMDRIDRMERKLGLTFQKYISDDKSVYDIMAHTWQAYDLWVANELNFLRDIYTDKKCLDMANILRIRESLKDIGQFLVCTKDVLNAAETSLSTEISNAV